MQNGEQILREFLFWAKRLIVHHNEFALVHFTEMLDEREAKASQPILMGNDEGPDLTSDDTIHQSKQLLALKVQTAANFFEPFIDGQSASGAELFKVLPLIREIGLLCRT